MRRAGLVLVPLLGGCGVVVSEDAFSGRWRIALHQVELEGGDTLSAEHAGLLDCDAAYATAPSGSIPSTGPSFNEGGCVAFLTWDLDLGVDPPALVPVIDPPLREVVVSGEDFEDLDTLYAELPYAGARHLFDMTELQGRAVELRAPGLSNGVVTFDAVLYLTKD